MGCFCGNDSTGRKRRDGRFLRLSTSRKHVERQEWTISTIDTPAPVPFCARPIRISSHPRPRPSNRSG